MTGEERGREGGREGEEREGGGTENKNEVRTSEEKGGEEIYCMCNTAASETYTVHLLSCKSLS